MSPLTERNKQRHMDAYKTKSNEELIDEKDKIEYEMMTEAITTYSDEYILVSLAMRYGYITYEISRRIACGSW